MTPVLKGRIQGVTLALIAAQPAVPEPLHSSDRRAQQLRVHLDPEPATALRASR